MWCIEGVIAEVLRRRSPPWLGHAAMVALVLAAELGVTNNGLSGGIALLALAAAALMPLRRRHPVVMIALVTVLYVIGLGPPAHDAPVSAMMIALYSVGRHASPRASICVAAVSVPVNTAFADLSADAPLTTVAAVTLIPLMPVAAGYIVRLRDELETRRLRQVAETAVREERRRIARELHDVIAHHVSVIGLYMGVARRTIPMDPERARQTLLTGEETARQAMTEMRHLLDVLRTDGEPVDDQADVGVARLPALVEESGNATLEVTGEAVDLPTTVDHAVYRIVQEALTNTRKHAAGARARVWLAYRPGLVQVEVGDDGPGRAGGAGAARAGGEGLGTGLGSGLGAGLGAGLGSRLGAGRVNGVGVGVGLGLAGMAERVSLCGGELRAGPSPAGGFVVHARIPLLEKT